MLFVRCDIGTCIQSCCQDFAQKGVTGHVQLCKIAFQARFFPCNAHRRKMLYLIRQSPISSSVNWFVQGGAMTPVSLPLAMSLRVSAEALCAMSH